MTPRAWRRITGPETMSYETGVWVFLIVVVVAFLGLILWMGYAILL